MKNLLKFKIQNLCLFTLVITSCFISGCGFHLAKPMSAKNPLYIQIESSQPRSRFTQILVSTLKENNIIPQEQKNNKTKYFILVGPLENTTSIKSISGNALAGTYRSYQVTVTFVPMNTKNKKTDLESRDACISKQLSKQCISCSKR